MSAVPESVPSLELLDPEAHRHLRLRPSQDVVAPHFVQVVPGEFTTAAACCPVLITKDNATGAFYAGAMFGFQPRESFLDELTTRGGFKPLALQRDGFYINGEHVAIDRSNSRFSDIEGERLFDDAGQPNSCLRQIQRVLGQLQSGLEATTTFMGALAAEKLIEPIDVSLNFGGEMLTLQGLYTVSLDAIRQLESGAALRLLRAGYLQHAYILHGSLQQIPVLARMRDQVIRKLPKKR
jgi:hypothetical protein